MKKERLTETVFGYKQLKACENDFCKETCEQYDDEESCDNCPIQKAIEKLAEYEDLDDLLREKLNDVAVNIITASKKDFSEWIDRILWTNKRCDELAREVEKYRDLEEQGLLLRLPVAVGDVVYYFAFGKVFSAEVVEIKYICEAENYGKFIRQRITLDGDECGIVIIDFSDIGKKYFLAQSAAEEKLRELEGK